MSHRSVVWGAVGLLTAALFSVRAPASAVAGTSVAHQLAQQKYCRIIAASATVREKPRKSAAAIGVAYREDTCSAQGRAGHGGDWVKLTMKDTGASGYVYSSLVSWGEEHLGRTGG